MVSERERRIHSLSVCSSSSSPLLRNQRRRIIRSRQTLLVRIAIEIRLHETNHQPLHSHRNLIASETEQRNDDQQEIDNRQQAQGDDVPELDAAERTAALLAGLAFGFHHADQHEPEGTFRLGGRRRVG